MDNFMSFLIVVAFLFNFVNIFIIKKRYRNDLELLKSQYEKANELKINIIFKEIQLNADPDFLLEMGKKLLSIKDKFSLDDFYIDFFVKAIEDGDEKGLSMMFNMIKDESFKDLLKKMYPGCIEYILAMSGDDKDRIMFLRRSLSMGFDPALTILRKLEVNEI